MKKMLLMGLLILNLNAETIRVQVYKSQPVYEDVKVKIPYKECYNEYVKDNSATAPLIGGVVGGILGHQVGKGSGKTAATVAGAIIGTMVGDNIGNNNEEVYKEVKKCKTVYKTEIRNRLIGYENYANFYGRTIKKFYEKPLDYIEISINY